jgi:signal transduction histidine kinase
MDVGRGLVAQLDLETVLRDVVEVARELTGARYAALGVLDDDRRELERFIFVGIDQETRAQIGDLPRGHGVLGELIRDPAPLRLRNIGEHPRSFGFPPGHPQMRSFLGVPILVRGQAYGNLYLTEKASGEFDEADEEAVTILAEWASIAIFNTRLLGQSEEERGSLERAVHALEAMSEIARAVGGETDRELVLETIAKRTRALVGAKSLLVLLRDGRRHEIVAAAGECGSAPIGEVLSLDSSLVPVDAIHAAAALGIESRAALVAPLGFRGKMLGWIVALDRIEEGPEFFAEDERLLVAAAASAAIAVSTVQSVTEDLLRSSLITAERERARWARELHDSILQGLASRRLALSSALKRGPEQLDATVRDVVEEIANDVDELRSLITELRPATLDELGLVAALEDLAHRLENGGEFELTCDLSVDPGALDHELETVVYRLVQEALTNVAKHSGASTVTLRVAGTPERIEVLVSDDGVGFDPKEIGAGFGIVGMRERVELAGGELEIDSAPGSGTRVIASIPVSERRARQGKLGTESTAGSD